MTTRLPTFAKMSQAIAYVPGLFSNSPTQAADKLMRLDYEVNSRLRVRFVGPQCGVPELRVLQALVALAGGSKPQDDAPASDAMTLHHVAALLSARAIVRTTYNQLARVAGYQPNTGSSKTIRDALELLYSVSVFVSGTDAQSKDFEAGRLFTKLSSRSTDSDRDGTLEIDLCPVLAAAALGGRGEYVRIDLAEAHKLGTKAARLLHQRLHWVNRGQRANIGIEALTGYVYPELASADTQRKRQERVRKAVLELRKAGWTIMRVGDKYTVGRPASKPSDSVARALPDRSRDPS